MKKLLVLILVALPLGSFASVIRFKCKSMEIPDVHKFDASGAVRVDEYSKAEGYVNIQLEKAQAPGSLQVFQSVKVIGSHQHFEDGRANTSAFDQLILNADHDYLASFSLLLDFKSEMASHVFSIDNFRYSSNCVIESIK